MILDNLRNAARYTSLHPLLKQAFDYLASLDPATLEPGKHILIEDRLIIAVNDSTLKPAGKARLEIHDDFMDIHLPLSSGERFAWRPRHLLQHASEPFNREKDARHYDDEPATFFEAAPGDFVIFFPEDGHAGCIGEGSIRKIVVKVRIGRLPDYSEAAEG